MQEVPAAGCKAQTTSWDRAGSAGGLGLAISSTERPLTASEAKYQTEAEFSDSAALPRFVCRPPRPDTGTREAKLGGGRERENEEKQQSKSRLPLCSSQFDFGLFSEQK